MVDVSPKNKRRFVSPGKLINNEIEEPITIAQRFINIFRQLHVFNEDHQIRFENMILECPDEVRMLFDELPGGSAVLEYIQDLEEANGLNQEETFEEISDEEKSKARVLATALAEAQEKTAEKSHQQALELAREQAEVLALSHKQSQETSRRQIEQLTKSITRAQQQNNASEIKQLTQSLQQAQSEMLAAQTKAISEAQQLTPEAFEMYKQTIGESIDRKSVV